MEPLSLCTKLEGQLKQLRHSLYEDEHDRSLDISTEIIKTGMEMRDTLWRMSYVSGEKG